MSPLFGVFVLAGCAVTTDAVATDISGNWVLGQLNQTAPSQEITLTLDSAAQTVSGRAPCNKFSGRYDGVFPDFRTGPLLSTKRACPALALEREFLGTLSSVTHATVEDEVLLLSDESGERLRFKRAE